MTLRRRWVWTRPISEAWLHDREKKAPRAVRQDMRAGLKRPYQCEWKDSYIMPRSSWGSIQKLGRDRWRLRYWGDKCDGRGYRRISETVSGARRRAHEVLAVRCTTYAGDSYKPTLGDVYTGWWLPDAEDRLSEGSLAKNTLDLYETMWRVHIAPRWSECVVADIRPSDVQEWLLGLSRWTAVNCKSLAGSITNRGILMGVIDADPFKRPYRMPKDVSAREKGVWKLKDIEKAVSLLKGTVAEVPAILCALGSCRVGEACAARCNEVEMTIEHGMEVARIPISRQLMRSGEVSTVLKNPQSIRTVCIPEPWSSRVRELAEENLSQGLPWLNDDGFGSPVKRSTVKRFWERAVRPQGVLSELKRIPMQNLRNSWQTFMRWELGVDPDLIDSMMGHSGKDIRTRHYDRPMPVYTLKRAPWPIWACSSAPANEVFARVRDELGHFPTFQQVDDVRPRTRLKVSLIVHAIGHKGVMNKSSHGLHNRAARDKKRPATRDGSEQVWLLG